MLNIYVIDDGETHWVCAASPEEALKYIGDYAGDSHLDPNFYVLPHDHQLTMINMDEKKHPRTTKSVAEWIKDNGPGIIGSTAY